VQNRHPSRYSRIKGNPGIRAIRDNASERSQSSPYYYNAEFAGDHRDVVAEISLRDAVLVSASGVRRQKSGDSVAVVDRVERNTTLLYSVDSDICLNLKELV
jgi:hypothetical protein